jgi:Transposase DDE domain
VASTKVARHRALAAILDSPEIGRLISELEATRWTGRPGYPIRSLLGVALTKSIYAIPTWSRTVALIHEHPGLQDALSDCPSVYAAYRFATKLRIYDELLKATIDRVLRRLGREKPHMGQSVAIDASDLPAYANGQRFVCKGGPEREKYSDPDASWGHRSAISTRKGGGFYGFKVHMATCTETGLPLAWRVRSAREHEVPHALLLLDAVLERHKVHWAMMDKGYDHA